MSRTQQQIKAIYPSTLRMMFIIIIIIIIIIITLESGHSAWSDII